MHSVSMTVRLGLAAIVGAIAVVILAHSEDRANFVNRCKTEKCTISTVSIDQILRKNVPRSTQISNRSADGQMIRSKKETVKPMAVKASEPVRKEPAPRLAKKTRNGKVIKVTGSEPVSKKAAQRLVKKDKSVQALAVIESEPLRKRPAQPSAKKPAQPSAKKSAPRMVELEQMTEPQQESVEKPRQQVQRSRRDDGYTW